MHRSRLALRTCQRALSSSTPGRAAAASTSTSTSYQPPVKAGSLPAYDAALEYIQQDRENKLKQLEQLKQSGAAQDKLDKLEVEAWSNDPETRWRAKTGAGDMSKPVYRQLAERKWRKEGDLAILVRPFSPRSMPTRAAADCFFYAQMQRVTQMHVTPDLLAEINPQADVRIQVAGETIEPGVFTAPARVRQACRCIIRLTPTELTPCCSFTDTRRIRGDRSGLPSGGAVVYFASRRPRSVALSPACSPSRSTNSPCRRQTCPRRWTRHSLPTRTGSCRFHFPALPIYSSL